MKPHKKEKGVWRAIKVIASTAVLLASLIVLFSFVYINPYTLGISHNSWLTVFFGGVMVSVALSMIRLARWALKGLLNEDMER